MSTPSLVARITSLKQALTKADSDEARKDVLQQLDAVPDVNVGVLSETLIGKAVSAYKNHATLGPLAKSIIKKWKAIAKAPPTAPVVKKEKAPAAPNVKKSAGEPKKDATTSNKPPSSSAEWASLPTLRKNICQKFYDIFLLVRPQLLNDGINADAVDQLLGPRAAELEASVQEFSKGDTKAYTDKARSLCFNLKKNAELTQQVVLGQVDDLVSWSSEDLASAETRQARAVEAKKLIDSKRLDWDQANEDKINQMCGIKGDLLSASLFTCGRCKSVKTTSTQKQTRSADEPMTVFVLCLNCGNRWKC